MNTTQTTQFISNIKTAREAMAKMSSAERKTLEKSWDIEHAYYSSTLEGSKIDRKEFDKMAEKVK